MRWALLGLALLLAVAGLLYRGGVAFVSSLSDAVDGPGTVAATRGQMQAAARPDRSPAEPVAATGAPASEPSRAEPAGPGSSLAPQPGVRSDLESSPVESEQRVFRSRKALETVDPREFLRQQASR
jgi:hypothetical protein